MSASKLSVALILVVFACCLVAGQQSDTSDGLQMLDRLLDRLIDRPGELICMACHGVVKELQATGGFDAIEKRAQDICKVLDHPLEVKMCKRAIRKIADQMKRDSPDQICKDLELC